MKYAELCGLLADAGIPEPQTEAELLIGHFFAVPRHELIFRRGEDFSSPAFTEALRRRLTREPLQYILGSWCFRGLDFTLNRATLIPRPDTELCVELAVRHLPPGAVFADIGTGSGAIAVSVLHERPDTRALAADISAEALAAAAENARRAGVSDRFTPLLLDALAPDFAARLSAAAPGLCAIISNPPYIPTADLASLAPELSFEPRLALDGGSDGLVFYRALTAAADRLLGDGGLLLFEVGIGEAPAVSALGTACGFRASVFPDLAGIDRAVLMRRSVPNSSHL